MNLIGCFLSRREMTDMFYNSKQEIERILDVMPEEFSWIEYKSACDFNQDFREKIKYLVTSFLNSFHRFGYKKYIIFGIYEDRVTKKKTRTGLCNYIFPDDNVWQNLFDSIKPIHPNIETGTLEYKGLLYGYILIYEDNYFVPYYCNINGKDTFYIRRGGNKYNDMNDLERAALIKKKEEIEQNGKLYQKTNVLNLLVTLGQYNESNESDIRFIECESGRSYKDIKSHCLYMDSSLTQNEKSIYGIGRSETVYVQNKRDRLLQFTSDEVADAMTIIAHVLGNADVLYSSELLEGVGDTLVILSNAGFSYHAKKIIESTTNVYIFESHKYSHILSQYAEVHPCFILDFITDNKEVYQEQNPTVKAAARKALRVIAWFPEYYEIAVKLLIEFNDHTIHELFECGEIATAASFNQKLSVIKEIVDTDKDLTFNILKKVLDYNPVMGRMIGHFYVPEKYKRLFSGVHSINIEQLQVYYSILLESVGNNVEKILELLPAWLIPLPFNNLQLLANHIETIEPSIECADDRQKLWNRLCNTPLVYITGAPMSDLLKDKLVSIGNKFRPDDLYKQYQQWFRKDIISALCTDGTNFDDVCRKVFDEQKNILLNLYKSEGINGMVDFINTVNISSSTLRQLLFSADFALTVKDDNILATAFLDHPQIYSGYLQSKSYHEKIAWIKKLNLDDWNINDQASLFAVLYPTMENIKCFEEKLGEEIRRYWQLLEPNIMEDAAVVKYAYEMFINFDMHQKAFDLLQCIQGDVMQQLPPQWLFDALMNIEKYPKCCICCDTFQEIYRFLSDKISEDMREKLECLSLNQYGKIQYAWGYADLMPRVIFRRIANEPVFFVSIVKDAMNDFFGVSDHLLRHCDEKPKMISDWMVGIDSLMMHESEKLKQKADYWIGYILYNMLESIDNNYQIGDDIATLLEKSEKRRQGFCCHAYYPNRFHSHGRYEEDSKDRENAEKFKNMAEVQNQKSNTEFANFLKTLADQLIMGVESEI